MGFSSYPRSLSSSLVHESQLLSLSSRISCPFIRTNETNKTTSICVSPPYPSSPSWPSPHKHKTLMLSPRISATQSTASHQMLEEDSPQLQVQLEVLYLPQQVWEEELSRVAQALPVVHSRLLPVLPVELLTASSALNSALSSIASEASVQVSSIESVASTATGAVKSSLVSQASSISAAAASKASEVSARISSGVADATGTGSPTSSSTAGAAVMTAAPIWGAAIGAALYLV